MNLVSCFVIFVGKINASLTLFYLGSYVKSKVDHIATYVAAYSILYNVSVHFLPYRNVQREM